MHQIRPISWKEKLTRTGYFFGALLLHLLLFLMVATLVIFEAPKAPANTEFQLFHIAAPPPRPQAPPPPAGDAANMAAEPQPITVPPTTPPNVISVTQNTSFQVNTSKIMEQTLSHLNLPSPQSTGMTEGGGNLTSGSGASTSVSFFGVQTKGSRIAFLLDYSGSMKGAFRQTMEVELEKSLTALPGGTQVILICWAGPAWLYNQTEPEIANKWRMIDGYDNFTTAPGASLDPPKWIGVDPASIGDIMKNIKAQVAAPGGTDWRQPFLYAMRADPPPDTFFFLTDGQIPPATAERAQAAIATAMHQVASPPQINSLWIKNRQNKSDEMEKLAKAFKGEFRVVTPETGAP